MKKLIVIGTLALALSAPAQANAPTLEQMVSDHEQKLNSLGVWMEDCINRTTLRPAGRTWSKRHRKYVPTYALVMTRDQIKDCISDHRPQD